MEISRSLLPLGEAACSDESGETHQYCEVSPSWRRLTSQYAGTCDLLLCVTTGLTVVASVPGAGMLSADVSPIHISSDTEDIFGFIWDALTIVIIVLQCVICLPLFDKGISLEFNLMSKVKLALLGIVAIGSTIFTSVHIGVVNGVFFAIAFGFNCFLFLNADRFSHPQLKVFWWCGMVLYVDAAVSRVFWEYAKSPVEGTVALSLLQFKAFWFMSEVAFLRATNPHRRAYRVVLIPTSQSLLGS